MGLSKYFIVPLYAILNLFILFRSHTFIPTTPVSSNQNSVNGTSLSSENSTNHSIMDDYNIPDFVREFVERMVKNGVDDIELMDLLFCGCVVLLGLELISEITLKVARYLRKDHTIPVRGKHLDELSAEDLVFISMNKIATVPFVFMLVKFMYHEPTAHWSLSALTFKNTILPLPAIFIIYDFFYTILHWALHIQSVYGYIHKHHHRQKAPSRGNVDAVNVHPVEFFLGEYNHLLAVYIFTHVLGCQLHIFGMILFLVVGGTLTGLNHSRFDSNIILFGKSFYDSKWHDVHHRIPQSNYGQYINFWDLIFGTFRVYSSDDRVNTMSQLDPLTGKSYEHAKRSAVKND